MASTPEFAGTSNDAAVDTATVASSILEFVGIFALCLTTGRARVIGVLRFIDISCVLRIMTGVAVLEEPGRSAEGEKE